MTDNAFFKFDPFDLPPEAEAIRPQIREFLAKEMAGKGDQYRGRTWSGYDEEFSRKLGEAGFLGMVWPKKYGGHERTALERYVVLEETLAADAPTGAHWIGDRQSGPMLLKFGTEDQRMKYLPRVAKGEIFFCIGMSEPDSGSDLASVRTKAEKVDGGYLVNGRKVWTTNANKVNYMIGLFRTATDPDDRHKGLTQFIVDLKNTDGITIRPIPDLTGTSHFNEVTFDNVFVPDAALVGEKGNGWSQVSAELVYERSGPERFLSCISLIKAAIDRVGPDPDRMQKIAIGKLVSHLVTFRRMSISIAGMLQAGENPLLEASVVKDQGALFEQSIPHICHAIIEAEPAVGAGDQYAELLAYLMQTSVSFSMRGGTREILRGIIARGLGLR
jgi:acyl-CoA dehydrogenase-like protein